MNERLPATAGPVLSDAMAMLQTALANKVDAATIAPLYELIDGIQTREAEKRFNAAFVRAQAEMEPVFADATNPQTRSKYATYHAVLRAAQPIYTAHGFGVTFTQEPSDQPGMVRVVGFLTHEDGFIRRYQIDVPRENKGLRGGDAMTPMHQVGAGFTYGKRYCLIAMWNLAIDPDTDGNVPRQPYRPAPAARSMDELTDPQTGEVVDHVAPFKLEMREGQTWADFIEPLQRYINHCRSIAEWDEWRLLNQDLLLKLKETKPQLFRLFEKNVEAKYEELTK
ncbi:ERF family protein [Bradyrhizobium jicamae]|uniref:ERF family protein n=1 Tax=Bradyrhizobium jicamae TaxID=280332 RepID=UPI001BADE39B|nr:ERF family protein [Bradyrhizobium jicamae]MBR0753468.1 ERF family protein [Bradyrhizobium jicamae]